LASNPTPDGGVPKRYAGIAIVDFTAGSKLVYGITCALLQRARIGRGERVDSSLMEAALGLQRQKLITIEEVSQTDLQEGTTADKMRAASEKSASAGARELYYRTYQTSDGFITVGCLNIPQRHLLHDMLEMEDPWHENPDQLPVSEEEDRARRALVVQAEARFRTRSTAEWMRLIEAEEIPCAPVQMSADVLQDPQVVASDYLFEYHYPGYGRVSSVGTGVRVGDQGGVHLPPPKLGEHTEAVLAELGLNPSSHLSAEASVADTPAMGVAMSPS
jgi:crotonobetainyl-CoA:carnitine CoA-transferase CaiB-like acyl-CoA transferase